MTVLDRFDPEYDARESAGYRDLCVNVEVRSVWAQVKGVKFVSDGMEIEGLPERFGDCSCLPMERDSRGDKAHM